MNVVVSWKSISNVSMYIKKLKVWQFVQKHYAWNISYNKWVIVFTQIGIMIFKRVDIVFDKFQHL